MRKMVVRGAVVACMSGFALVGLAAPAFAGTAPSCVIRDLRNFNHIIVTNKCGVTMRLKIVWSHARDSSCFTLANGQSRDENAYNQPLAAYDKTVTC